MGQIGESFEAIGQDVARETVQAPKDIVGKALETAGLGSGKKKKGNNKTPAQGQAQSPESGAGSAAQAAKEEEMAIKQIVARRALEEISGRNRAAQKEPTVWERLQKEEEEKKEMEKKKKELAAKQALPQSSGKRPRGDLYGKKAKKTQVENKNLRQD